jgi:glycosyltransferase involved in cell wall biosynthesis
MDGLARRRVADAIDAVNSAMHVALLFEYPTLNGGERSMLSILQHLRNNDAWTFSAVGPADGAFAAELASLNVPVTNLEVHDSDGKRSDRFALMQQVCAAVNQIQPSVVHANSLAMSRLLGGCRRSGWLAPVAATGHIRDIVRMSKAAITDINTLTMLVAVSDATRRFHAGQGVESHRLATVYNGIDPPTVSAFNRNRQRRRISAAIGSATKLVLNVGQICLRKAQGDLARGVLALVARGVDVHLVMAGARFSKKLESQQYEQSIADQFAKAGASDRLHLLGYRTDVAELMHASDVLVHTAKQEPFGRVLLEAASIGLPIVCTNVGGTEEMLRPDVDALLYPIDDAAALETAMLTALQNPETARQRARNAKQRVTSNFTVPGSANALCAIWRNAVRP